jgi:sulfate transport system ATP-binding protein
VRVELTNAATGGLFTAQITRGDAEALRLEEGDTVYVRATRVPIVPDDALPHNDAQADPITASPH